tara:strand:- start:568 stop:1164 length:597 start_codon:yes stop_codon:yes gene_type:complete
MGRRAREERREQREDKVSEQTKVKRKNSLKAAGILAIIMVISGYSVFVFINLDSDVPGAPPGAGKLGSEHEHASLLVIIFGDKFNFAVPNYQIKSSWIHFEDSDGTTIHRHASGVMLDYLFANINIGIDSECYIFPDGRQFCTNEDYSLKYYINHELVKDIRDHVIEEGDRILITYGNETPEQIEEQLMKLDSQIIQG